MGCNPMIWTILPHDAWGKPHDAWGEPHDAWGEPHDLENKKYDHTKIPHASWGINPMTKIKFNFFDKIKNQPSKINRTL